MAKRFIITGGGFQNKGAQAMFFTTVSELKSRFPDCEIYMVSARDVEQYDKTMSFKIVAAYKGDWQYAQGGFGSIQSIARNIFKYLRGEKPSYSDMFRLKRILQETTAIVDISGYGLSSEWDKESHNGFATTARYLNVLKTAKKLKIPVFLMPQSFGPFNYQKEREKKLLLIKRYLAYPVRIFAREEAGYRILVDNLGLHNVEKTMDLVLQNKGIDIKSIFRNKTDFSVAELETKGNVGIIPNAKLFEHGDRDELVHTYAELAEKLVANNKNVYLLWHATGDSDICKLIYDKIKDRSHIRIFEKELNCFEFSKLVRQFDYLIASRYHSIIHAYREGIPAIVLGWADKYNELLRGFSQENYIFDVRQGIDPVRLANAVLQMNDCFKIEQNKIIAKLKDVQEHNCFDSLTLYIDSKQSGQLT